MLSSLSAEKFSAFKRRKELLNQKREVVASISDSDLLSEFSARVKRIAVAQGYPPTDNPIVYEAGIAYTWTKFLYHKLLGTSFSPPEGNLHIWQQRMVQSGVSLAKDLKYCWDNCVGMKEKHCREEVSDVYIPEIIRRLKKIK